MPLTYHRYYGDRRWYHSVKSTIMVCFRWHNVLLVLTSWKTHQLEELSICINPSDFPNIIIGKNLNLKAKSKNLSISKTLIGQIPIITCFWKIPGLAALEMTGQQLDLSLSESGSMIPLLICVFLFYVYLLAVVPWRACGGKGANVNSNMFRQHYQSQYGGPTVDSSHTQSHAHSLAQHTRSIFRPHYMHCW